MQNESTQVSENERLEALRQRAADELCALGQRSREEVISQVVRACRSLALEVSDIRARASAHAALGLADDIVIQSREGGGVRAHVQVADTLAEIERIAKSRRIAPEANALAGVIALAIRGAVYPAVRRYADVAWDIIGGGVATEDAINWLRPAGAPFETLDAGEESEVRRAA